MGKTISKKKKDKNNESGSMFIDNFKNVVTDMVSDVMGLDIFAIKDINSMNYEIMKSQMSRNDSEKEFLLGHSGASAYVGGNPENYSEVPQIPSYTSSHNYLNYHNIIHNKEREGYLTTYTGQNGVKEKDKDNVFNKTHYYWDLADGQIAIEENQPEASIGIRESDDESSRNSLLYKTRKLMNEGKIKTIVSQFHTDRSIVYNGQVATNNFGESHGRNLLTKNAEDYGYTNYKPNGFDNPYCRVWTHHHQYDRLSRTMRAGKSGINYWGEAFEWTDAEKLRLFPQYSSVDEDTNNENYAYAWRGYHNQSRRERYSALDTDTGLLKIAPKYVEGGESNVHTKDCMFSIENLAWKDYDPYSFTQALSWEQRGPLGGRIMWFPPYGITFNESSNVTWNSSDFIGRGEKIYTYVNTERRGNLSFYMLTDHPSSIDYSSWYYNDEDKENDYHRYFAGCMGGDSDNDMSGRDTDDSVWIEDNITEKPTWLTDEYSDPNIPNITADAEYYEDEPVEEDDKNPEIVEFFVFFPNNYSGINDGPSNPDSPVNAMAYLLYGRDANKYTNPDDLGIYYDIMIDKNCLDVDGDVFFGNGYEMREGQWNGLTERNCETMRNEYIVGGVYGRNDYVPDSNKKWCYRIDHVLDNDGDYKGGECGYKNTITQKLTNPNENYKDKISYGLNKDVSAIPSSFYNSESGDDTLYSYAEVACALYNNEESEDTFYHMYESFDSASQDRVKKLIDLFENHDLLSVTCKGMSTEHGDNVKSGKERNEALAANRARTVLAWLRTYERWANIENSSGDDLIEEASVDLDTNTNNVNDKKAKLYRCAHCILEFAVTDTVNINECDPTSDHVSNNENFKNVEFVDWGRVYDAGDMVQYEDRIYTCIVPDYFTPCPEETENWTECNWMDMTSSAKVWSDADSYNRGDIVLYNGIFYEVLNPIEGNSPSGSSEYKELLNFVELTDKEVDTYVAAGIITTNRDRKFYRKKNSSIVYNQVAGNESEFNDEEVRDAINRCGDIWVIDKETNSLKLLCEQTQSLASLTRDTVLDTGYIVNKLRYDQEYHFYKQYFKENPMVFKSLQEKIKYFNPVFHSMTPEGFNARLTFLHQCTRQGMTKTMGDRGGKTANNLAFGRPPYCVLRLGDFYNQLIVINSISFDYSVSDGITWDLNTEGNGVQPMLCKVNIDFNFIGGGDITGPVRRLQNAMSFNYYANTSFYDNRADRVVYDGENYKTMGGAGNNRVNENNSYAYTPKIYDDRVITTKVK